MHDDHKRGGMRGLFSPLLHIYDMKAAKKSTYKYKNYQKGAVQILDQFSCHLHEAVVKKNVLVFEGRYLFFDQLAKFDFETH